MSNTQNMSDLSSKKIKLEYVGILWTISESPRSRYDFFYCFISYITRAVMQSWGRASASQLHVVLYKICMCLLRFCIQYRYMLVILVQVIECLIWALCGNKYCFVLFCPAWDSEFEFEEWVWTRGLFISRHIRRKYWRGSQEADCGPNRLTFVLTFCRCIKHLFTKNGSLKWEIYFLPLPSLKTAFQDFDSIFGGIWKSNTRNFWIRFSQPGSVLIKLESMLNWVCVQVLKPNLSLRLYGRLNLKLWFDRQKQRKYPQVKSFSRRFIKLDLSNFEISCSAELSMKKVL